MGQKLSASAQRRLLEHPRVKIVTAEHIILKDGTVLDPNEFVFEDGLLILVKKLRRCHCGLRHQPGAHVLVEVWGGTTILGNLVIGPALAEHPLCAKGDWEIEETITEADARKYGLIPQGK